MACDISKWLYVVSQTQVGEWNLGQFWQKTIVIRKIARTNHARFVCETKNWSGKCLYGLDGLPSIVSHCSVLRIHLSMKMSFYAVSKLRRNNSALNQSFHLNFSSSGILRVTSQSCDLKIFIPFFLLERWRNFIRRWFKPPRCDARRGRGYHPKIL